MQKQKLLVTVLITIFMFQIFSFQISVISENAKPETNSEFPKPTESVPPMNSQKPKKTNSQVLSNSNKKYNMKYNRIGDKQTMSHGGTKITYNQWVDGESIQTQIKTPYLCMDSYVGAMQNDPAYTNIITGNLDSTCELYYQSQNYITTKTSQTSNQLYKFNSAVENEATLVYAINPRIKTGKIDVDLIGGVYDTVWTYTPHKTLSLPITPNNFLNGRMTVYVSYQSYYVSSGSTANVVYLGIYVWDYVASVWDVSSTSSIWLTGTSSPVKIQLQNYHVIYTPQTVSQNIRSQYKYTSPNTVVHQLDIENFDYGTTISIAKTDGWQFASISPSATVTENSTHVTISDTVPVTYTIQFHSQTDYILAIDQTETIDFENETAVANYFSYSGLKSKYFDTAWSYSVPYSSYISLSYTTNQSSSQTFSMEGVSYTAEPYRWQRLFLYVNDGALDLGGTGKILLDSIQIFKANPSVQTISYNRYLAQSQFRYWDGRDNPIAPNIAINMILQDRTRDPMFYDPEFQWSGKTDANGMFSTTFSAKLSEKEYVLGAFADDNNFGDFIYQTWGDAIDFAEGDTEGLTRSGTATLSAESGYLKISADTTDKYTYLYSNPSWSPGFNLNDVMFVSKIYSTTDAEFRNRGYIDGIFGQPAYKTDYVPNALYNAKSWYVTVQPADPTKGTSLTRMAWMIDYRFRTAWSSTDYALVDYLKVVDRSFFSPSYFTPQNPSKYFEKDWGWSYSVDGWLINGQASNLNVLDGTISFVVDNDWEGIKYDFPLLIDWSKYDGFEWRVKTNGTTLNVWNIWFGDMSQSSANRYSFSFADSDPVNTDFTTYFINRDWSMTDSSTQTRWTADEMRVHVDGAQPDGVPFIVDLDFLRFYILAKISLYDSGNSFFLSSTNNSLVYSVWSDGIYLGDYSDLMSIPKNTTIGTHNLTYVPIMNSEINNVFVPDDPISNLYTIDNPSSGGGFEFIGQWFPGETIHVTSSSGLDTDFWSYYTYLSPTLIQHVIVFETGFFESDLTFSFPSDWSNIDVYPSVVQSWSGNSLTLSSIATGAKYTLIGYSDNSQNPFIVALDRYRSYDFENNLNTWEISTGEPFESYSFSPSRFFDGSFSINLTDNIADNSVIRLPDGSLPYGGLYVSFSYYIESFSGTDWQFGYYSSNGWVDISLDTSIGRWITVFQYITLAPGSSYILRFKELSNTFNGYIDNLKIYLPNTRIKTVGFNEYNISSIFRYWDGRQDPVAPNVDASFTLKERNELNTLDQWSGKTDQTGRFSKIYYGSFAEKEYVIKSYSIESWWGTPYSRDDLLNVAYWGGAPYFKTTSFDGYIEIETDYGNPDFFINSATSNNDLSNIDFVYMYIKTNVSSNSNYYWFLYTNNGYNDYFRYFVPNIDLNTWVSIVSDIDDFNYFSGSPNLGNVYTWGGLWMPQPIKTSVMDIHFIQSQNIVFTPQSPLEYRYDQNSDMMDWSEFDLDFFNDPINSRPGYVQDGYMYWDTNPSGSAGGRATAGWGGGSPYWERLFDNSFYNLVKLRAKVNSSATFYFRLDTEVSNYANNYLVSTTTNWNVFTFDISNAVSDNDGWQLWVNGNSNSKRYYIDYIYFVHQIKPVLNVVGSSFVLTSPNNTLTYAVWIDGTYLGKFKDLESIPRDLSGGMHNLTYAPIMNSEINNVFFSNPITYLYAGNSGSASPPAFEGNWYAGENILAKTSDGRDIYLNTYYAYVSSTKIQHVIWFQVTSELSWITFKLPIDWTNVTMDPKTVPLVGFSNGDYNFTGFFPGNNYVIYGYSDYQYPYVLAIDPINESPVACLDFECGSINGLYVYDYLSDGTYKLDWSLTNTFEGSTALDVRLDNYDALELQLEPGNYYVSFAYYLSYLEVNFRMGYKDSDGLWVYDVISDTTSPLNRWYQYFGYVEIGTGDTVNFALVANSGNVSFILDNLQFYSANPRISTIGYSQYQISSTFRYWDGRQNPIASNINANIELRDRTSNSIINRWTGITNSNGMFSTIYSNSIQEKEYELRAWSYMNWFGEYFLKEKHDVSDFMEDRDGLSSHWQTTSTWKTGQIDVQLKSPNTIGNIQTNSGAVSIDPKYHIWYAKITYLSASSVLLFTKQNGAWNNYYLPTSETGDYLIDWTEDPNWSNDYVLTDYGLQMSGSSLSNFSIAELRFYTVAAFSPVYITPQKPNEYVLGWDFEYNWENWNVNTYGIKNSSESGYVRLSTQDGLGDPARGYSHFQITMPYIDADKYPYVKTRVYLETPSDSASSYALWFMRNWGSGNRITNNYITSSFSNWLIVNYPKSNDWAGTYSNTYLDFLFDGNGDNSAINYAKVDYIRFYNIIATQIHDSGSSIFFSSPNNSLTYGVWSDGIYIGNYPDLQSIPKNASYGTHNLTYVPIMNSDIDGVFIPGSPQQYLYVTTSQGVSTIRIVDQRGNFIDPRQFRIFVDGVRIYDDSFMVNDTLSTFNLTITDFWNNILYQNIAQSYMRYYDFVRTLYNVKIWNMAESPVYLHITNGPTFSEWVMPGEIVEFNLATGTYNFTIEYSDPSANGFGTASLNGTKAEFIYTVDRDSALVVSGVLIKDIFDNTLSLLGDLSSVNSSIHAAIDYQTQNLTIQIQATNSSINLFANDLQILDSNLQGNFTLISDILNILDSNLASNFTKIVGDLNLINSSMVSNFIQVMGDLVQIDSNLASNFTKVFGDLTQINSSMANDFLQVMGDLNLINSSMISNFLQVIGDLNLIDGNLASNFTKIIGDLTLINSSMVSNFIQVMNDLNLMDSNLASNFTKIIGDLFQVNSTMITDFLQVFGNLKQLDSNLYSNFTKIVGDLNQINSSMVADFLQIMGDLTQINSSMVSNFLQVMGDLNLMDSNLASNFTKIVGDLILINSSMISNFLQIMGDLNLMDGNLASNFTQIVGDLTLINSSMVSNFIQVMGDLVQIDSNLASNFTKVFGDLTQINSSMANDFLQVMGDLTQINSSMTNNFLTVFGDLSQLNSSMTANFIQIMGDLLQLDSNLASNFTMAMNEIDLTNSTQVSLLLKNYAAIGNALSAAKEYMAILRWGVYTATITGQSVSYSLGTNWGNATVSVYLNGTLTTVVPESVGSFTLTLPSVGVWNVTIVATSGNSTLVKIDFYRLVELPTLTLFFRFVDSIGNYIPFESVAVYYSLDNITFIQVLDTPFEILLNMSVIYFRINDLFGETILYNSSSIPMGASALPIVIVLPMNSLLIQNQETRPLLVQLKSPSIAWTGALSFWVAANDYITLSLVAKTYDLRILSNDSITILSSFTVDLSQSRSITLESEDDLIVYSYSWTVPDNTGQSTLSLSTNKEEYLVYLYLDGVFYQTFRSNEAIAWQNPQNKNYTDVVFIVSANISKYGALVVQNVTRYFVVPLTANDPNTLLSDISYVSSMATDTVNITISTNQPTATVDIYHDGVPFVSGSLDRDFIVTKSLIPGLHNISVLVSWINGSGSVIVHRYLLTYWNSNYYTGTLEVMPNSEGLKIVSNEIDFSAFDVKVNGEYVRPLVIDNFENPSNDAINRSFIQDGLLYIRNTNYNVSLEIYDKAGFLIYSTYLDLRKFDYRTIALPLVRVEFNSQRENDTLVEMYRYIPENGSYVFAYTLTIPAGRSINPFWMIAGLYNVKAWDIVSKASLVFDQKASTVSFVQNQDLTNTILNIGGVSGSSDVVLTPWNVVSLLESSFIVDAYGEQPTTRNANDPLSNIISYLSNIGAVMEKNLFTVVALAFGAALGFNAMRAYVEHRKKEMAKLAAREVAKAFVNNGNSVMPPTYYKRR